MASSTVADPAAGHEIQLRRGLLAGIGVVLPGFVTLALLGSLLHYPAGLPGFWDYPSGTIGDALLVPTIVLGLFLQAQALRQWQVSSERRWQLLGVVVGAVGGAAVPLSWYLDPHTSHIWMLPRAHHYLLWLTLSSKTIMRRPPPAVLGALPGGIGGAVLVMR